MIYKYFKIHVIIIWITKAFFLHFSNLKRDFIKFNHQIIYTHDINGADTLTPNYFFYKSSLIIEFNARIVILLFSIKSKLSTDGSPWHQMKKIHDPLYILVTNIPNYI